MKLLKKILNITVYAFCAFVAVSLFVFLLGVVLLIVNITDTSIDAGEDVARVDWLPGSSSRVCWFKSNLSYAVEFNIPEKDFLEWVDSAEGRKQFTFGDIKPIAPTDQYPYWFYVPRYIKYLTPEHRSEKSLPPEPPEDLKIVHNSKPKNDASESRDALNPNCDNGIQSMASPQHGWMYYHSYGNGGGIWLAYDSDTSRVFYYHSPR